VRVLRRDEEDETEDSSQAEEHHVNTTPLLTISEIASGDSGDASNDVRWDAHKLRVVLGVAHVVHDGGEEERDRVKRGVDADSDQHVNVDLPVSESGVEVLDVVFVGEGASIQLQAVLDFVALSLSEEACAKERKSELDAKTRQGGFTYVSGLSWITNFATIATATVTIPSRMKIQAQPGFPAIPSISVIPRARRPPKAPAAVAAEKKMAMRRPHS